MVQVRLCYSPSSNLCHSTPAGRWAAFHSVLYRKAEERQESSPWGFSEAVCFPKRGTLPSATVVNCVG